MIGKVKDSILKHRYVLLIFLISMIPNIFVSLLMGYPIISDEYNIMAEGLFLDGNSLIAEAFLSLPNKNYYGFGYAVIYGWLGHVISNTHVLYLIVLCINSLFVSFISIFAYEICIEFKVALRQSLLAAIIAGGGGIQRISYIRSML